jgi:predicted GNAT family N-acyltransferase
MGEPAQFTVRRIRWDDAGDLLRAIRIAVFVEEQNVPEELEWDGLDPQSLHVLAQTSAGMAIGTARLLPDGHVGRMAVLQPWRRRGVGSAMVRELLAAATEAGHAMAMLNAQTQAIAFYERLGFEVTGGEFMDAGIPHRAMRRALAPATRK